jgi:tetratricopeptide (TPR) repeat protein
MEATAWHQLGAVYLQASRIEQAERAFRESARIEEDIGNQVGAAQSWTMLANLMIRADRLDEAEAWYTKSLTIMQTEGDRAGESSTRSNLADLLARCPGRLADAKAHAEQALAIKERLDPTSAEIWNTYSVLAIIADRQGNADAARDWRRRERASYAAAPVSRHNLRPHTPLIAAVVQAAADRSARTALEQVLASMVEHGWTSLVGALRRILDGERDEDALCTSLDREDSSIVMAVLRGIADPATLKEIAPAAPDGEAIPPARDS